MSAVRLTRTADQRRLGAREVLACVNVHGRMRQVDGHDLIVVGDPMPRAALTVERRQGFNTASGKHRRHP